MEHSVKFEIESLNISRRGSRYPDNVELGHSLGYFAEDGKEMHQELY